MSDSINNIETTTTTKTVNNSKLIEEIKSNLNNSIEQKQQEDEETCESKPMSTLSTNNNKRSYLEINETVNKYKPFMLKQLETKKLKPSETLSKVRDFLPLLKESTSKLLDAFKENPDDLNIENVQEDEEHIEMNLAVVSESEDSDDESDQEDEEEEETDTDDETEESNESNPLEQIDLDIKVTDKTKMNKIKLTKNKKVNKPMIKIVNDIDQQHDDSDDE